MAAKTKARKTAKKRVTKKAARPTAAVGGAFDILAGRKPKPDGPWKPGEGWAESGTGWGQWLKARRKA